MPASELIHCPQCGSGRVLALHMDFQPERVATVCSDCGRQFEIAFAPDFLLESRLRDARAEIMRLHSEMRSI